MILSLAKTSSKENKASLLIICVDPFHTVYKLLDSAIFDLTVVRAKWNMHWKPFTRHPVSDRRVMDVLRFGFYSIFRLHCVTNWLLTFLNISHLCKFHHFTITKATSSQDNRSLPVKTSPSDKHEASTNHIETFDIITVFVKKGIIYWFCLRTGFWSHQLIEK